MHPILLTGVALVGLPILLHLIMRQEPKRQPLPTFRFLKMKQRINERKIRLRHLLLLAMRMFLIALICLALFQPTLLSNRFNIRGEQPVAAIIVLDTSPSMGYNILSERSGLSPARKSGLKLLEESSEGPWTMLDEARARILELLDELPPNSKVAIIDSSDRFPDWSPTSFDARKKVQSIKRPRGNSMPVSRGVEQAYIMFGRLGSALEPDAGKYPRLLVVLSDRTTSSWDSARLEDLKTAREKVPPPGVNPIFLDVGIDKPVNMAIGEPLMASTVLDPRDDAVIRVAVQATGQAGENIISCRFDGEIDTDKRPVKVEAGEEKLIEFRRSKLKLGLHTAEIKLETNDALPFDNIRYVSFKVREPHPVLAIAEGETAYGWIGGGLLQTLKADMATDPFRRALDAGRDCRADLALTDQVVTWKPEEWSKYEAIALCSVTNPSGELWVALETYVNNGGKLIIFPPGPALNSKKLEAYDNVITAKLLPGKYEEWIVRPELDLEWDWDALDYTRPLLAWFGERRRDGYLSGLNKNNRLLVRKYWRVVPRDRNLIVVPFKDGDGVNPDTRNPAILEQRVGDRNGRVVMFAMTYNGRRDPGGINTAAEAGMSDSWNTYSQPRWSVVLSNLLIRYLVGETTQVPMSYKTGQMALVKWPLEPSPNNKPYYFGGPDVTTTDGVVTRDPKEIYFRWPPEKSSVPGNFTLTAEDKSWSDGFSLNIPGSFSRLDRVPLEELEPIFGKEGIAPVDKELKLREVLKGNLSQPLELFPFLMILLLLFMAFENLLANKFYRN